MIPGFKAPNGKLREDGVREIRNLRGEGKTYQEIATAVGVSLGTVFNVCTGRTWAWLTT